MTIQVIGAGFGRTGTASLKAALEALGFDRCYHMLEVIEHPAHAKVWMAAARGEPVDWDALFTGYRATVDWPGCSFYQTLMTRYPAAKVILTVRDPERWYASAVQTIYRIPRTFPLSILRHMVPPLRAIFRMQDQVFWEGTFHGRFADKAYAIEVFNRHIAEVRQQVPPERLLVYEISQGWVPLCRFLDVPVPADRPFPHLNDLASFQQMVAKATRSILALLATVLLALTGLIVALLRAQKRAR